MVSRHILQQRRSDKPEQQTASSAPKESEQAQAVETDALEHDFSRNLWCVLGLPLDNFDLAQAETSVRRAVLQRRQIVLSTPNVNWAVTALVDPLFRRAAINNELSTADGMPLVWIAKLLELPFTERVGGSNLTENLLRRAEDPPLSIFLFGGDEGVAEKACERINASPGGLKAVGCLYPGHGSVDSMSHPDIIATINTSAPDILLVAIGARKGQQWIDRNRHQLNARIISHLGATVNFLAGTIGRAPVWMQRAGLEWLWRVAQEPRLLSRYTKDGVVLAWLSLTRLLPYWIVLRFRCPTKEMYETLAIKLDDTAPTLRVILCGTATQCTARPIKPVLKRVTVARRDVIVDLAGVDYIDSAFIALLMILDKNVTRGGSEFRVEGASPYIYRLFRYNCAEFLLRAP